MLEPGKCTHHHGLVENLPKLSEQTPRFLRSGDQEGDSVADHASLHPHQFVGHGQHLDNKRRQP